MPFFAFVTVHTFKVSVFCAIMTTLGAVLFSWSNMAENDITFTVICCSLLSALFKPFEILLLRRSGRILTKEESESRKLEGMNVMTKAEMTLFYLIVCLITLIPFQFLLEGTASWNAASQHFGLQCNCTLIFMGSLLLLLYEWNSVALVCSVEPLLIGIGEQSESLWNYIIAMFLGGTTLHVCDCLDASDNDNAQCDDASQGYPSCPCFEESGDVFGGKLMIFHWFGLLFIIFGFMFYCYLKHKNLHVDNVNIFKSVLSMF